MEAATLPFIKTIHLISPIQSNKFSFWFMKEESELKSIITVRLLNRKSTNARQLVDWWWSNGRKPSAALSFLFHSALQNELMEEKKSAAADAAIKQLHFFSFLHQLRWLKRKEEGWNEIDGVAFGLVSLLWVMGAAAPMLRNKRSEPNPTKATKSMKWKPAAMQKLN